jgi:NADPH:quinone reductase-like Zn-dependent oxidoreductase
MKAITGPRYGPPEALRLRDMAKPVPKDDELPVRLCAATVTIEDVLSGGTRD